MIEVLRYGTNGIDQRTVVRIFMSNTHMSFTCYLNRLPKGILIAKQALGQTLCYDALIRLIKCKTPVALRQLIVEEVEESGVNKHDGALVITIFYHMIAMFYLSTLAHHAARLLHFRTYRLDIAGSLRPHKETVLTTHQQDAVSLLMLTVDGKLAPGVVAHQDDEHQRHHQACYIY